MSSPSCGNGILYSRNSTARIRRKSHNSSPKPPLLAFQGQFIPITLPIGGGGPMAMGDPGCVNVREPGVSVGEGDLSHRVRGLKSQAAAGDHT